MKHQKNSWIKKYLENEKSMFFEMETKQNNAQKIMNCYPELKLHARGFSFFIF